MAVYADFPYYQDFYCGTSITDAAAFRTAAARASDYIDNVTFGRLAGSVPEPFAEPVKNVRVRWQRYLSCSDRCMPAQMAAVQKSPKRSTITA